ncbi:cell filamentation protein Fic [Thalassotalea sp. 42_200_T64]|nr:cell filamentation protein Fic [Thalassotalea sp. 42_200_T64]
MSDKVAILTYLSVQNIAVTMKMLKEAIPFRVSERTVRRWLKEAEKEGKLIVHGQRRTTTYTSTSIGKGNTPFKFLEGKSKSLQEQILKSLRDFWTHNSTAIEGNTLTLGDTQFILDEGLTVSGKPIKEHQEIIGHASAIELVYRMLETGVTEQSFFDLHKSVQSEIIFDIDKPYGAWKVEINGTRVLGADNKPIYLEYAHPAHVEFLMSEVIILINENNHFKTPQDAIKLYTMIHAAIAHIHPFWDGNGRIARLIANIPLLKAGLPPIVIPNERRREYIQLLASYEMNIGKLDKMTGALPAIELLDDFELFCTQCYEETLNIISIS